MGLNCVVWMGPLSSMGWPHGADLVLFQVHGNAGHVVGELDEFAGHDFFEAVDAGDAVTDGDHRSGFGDIDGAFVIFNLLTEESGYFVCSNLSHSNLNLEPQMDTDEHR